MISVSKDVYWCMNDVHRKIFDKKSQGGCSHCENSLFSFSRRQWVISRFGLVLRSEESLSETAVTQRPQGVIIVGIYMSSNIYYYYYHRQQNIKFPTLHTDLDFPSGKCPKFSRAQKWRTLRRY